MTFPSQVNTVQAPAVAGAFADSNPRATVDAGPGGLVAGTNGLLIAAFAWADLVAGTAVNAGTGAPTGFVANDHSALITTFLADNGLTIPQGYPVTLFNAGSFWVKNTGAGAVTVGQKAFASNTTGQIQFAAAGATVAGYTETKWYAQSAAAAGELVKMTTWALG